LATARYDTWSPPAGYRIQLWDIGTGQELLCCQGHNSKVITLAFAPDDTRLACGLDDTTVLVWDVTPGLQRARRPVRDLSRAEREQLWAELAAEDAAKAHQAVGRLVAASGTAVDLLQERLQPCPERNPEPLRRLIRDLESPRFADREAAFLELKKLGEEVEPLLNQALEGNPVLELRRRVESLLASSHQVRDVAKLRRLRALSVLEQIGTSEARRVLKHVATGAAAARETQEAQAALERLARPFSVTR
jgi:hypothetical protein